MRRISSKSVIARDFVLKSKCGTRPAGELERSPRHPSCSGCHEREHYLAQLGALCGKEEGVEVNGRGRDELEGLGLLLNPPSPEISSSGQNACLAAELHRTH